MQTGTWVSVAGRLSHDTFEDRQQIDLFVDNNHDSLEFSNASNAQGVQHGPLVMAQNLVGDIDEVRVWNIARSSQEIDRLRRRKLHFGEDVATMGVLNVNEGLLSRSYTDDIRLSTWTAEAWFKTESPGVIIERLAGAGDDGLPLYNYRIIVDDEGYIQADFSFNTLVEISPIVARFRWATVTLNAPNRLVNDEQWHFVSLSYDGRDAILYVNGVVEARVTIDPAANVPGLGFPYWHMLEGEPNPPLSYIGLPATMATQDGGFQAGSGLLGQLDEVRVFTAGSTEEQMDARRFAKLSPTANNLTLYYDFDDLSDISVLEVNDKANAENGIADLLLGAQLDSGSGLNAPIEFVPVEILAPKLAAYFPMDDGTYIGVTPPRGFAGYQVSDQLDLLDFDHAGTFTTTNIYFMHNDRDVVTNYLAHTHEWTADTHFIVDSDGDGMPDWWEVYYGIDPNRIATADDPEFGPYGDPDQDGLSNLAEFRANTEPLNPDTTRSGFGDYDSRPSVFEPTFGQTFDDGDRIADDYEALYMDRSQTTLNRGLDPVYYDAHLDPDEDGWSNYAEFSSSADPTDAVDYPMPLVKVTARYHGRYGDSLADAMGVTTQTNVLDEEGNITTNTVEDATSSNVVVTIMAGDVPLHLHFYHASAMDGYPDAATMTMLPYTELRTVDSGRFVEGMNYVFGFLDVNTDGEWDPVEEPAGITSFYLGWGEWNEVEMPLRDDRQLRGFPRISWDPVPIEEQPVVTGYSVIAKDPRGNVMFTRFIDDPNRSYIHEGDYLQAGMFGIGGDGSDGAYTFEIYKNESVYGLDFDNLHETLIAIVPDLVTTAPTVLTGHDISFAYARNELAWTMDQNATWYQMTFRNNAANGTVGATTLLQTPQMLVPFRDIDGHYMADLPFYAGDVRSDGTVWTNDRYWVQITTGMEGGSAAASSWMPFNLNLQDPQQNGGKSMIEGKLYYFGGHDFFSDAARAAGAVTNQMPVIVQSFGNPGFSGLPDAQVTIAPSAWTNTEYRYEAVFQLKGLHRGSHYIRAFVDSNGNGVLDHWETWGFNRDLQTYYSPRRISLESEGVMHVQDQMVIIRDRDTDDDGLPDIWEYDKYARDPSVSATSSDFLTLVGGHSIGPNNLLLSSRWQYGLDGFTAIAIVDQNGNGIPDEWELYYYGMLLNAGSHLLDTDGDGMTDYDEYLNGSDPMNATDGLNVTSTMISSGAPVLTWSGVPNYRVMYTDSLMASWTTDTNLANYSRVSIGGGAYTWTYTDPNPPVGTTRFYRVIIVPDADGFP
jgi:hypothetical protein